MARNGLGRPIGSTDSSDKSSSVHLCSECGKEYTSRGGLRYHMRNYCVEGLVECPSCDKGFISKDGMYQHHTKEHGEQISKEKSQCDYCGSIYRVGFQEVGRFCSLKCCREFESEKHKLNRIEKFCLECGESFNVMPSQSDRRYCSQRCWGKTRTGPKNSNWQGGFERYYGPNWERQRRKALKRDQYRCQGCGKNASELRREPSVHHIRRLHWFKDNYDKPKWYKKANRLENLTTLCESCHKRWEGIPLKPQLLSA